MSIWLFLNVISHSQNIIFHFCLDWIFSLRKRCLSFHFFLSMKGTPTNIHLCVLIDTCAFVAHTQPQNTSSFSKNRNIREDRCCVEVWEHTHSITPERIVQGDCLGGWLAKRWAAPAEPCCAMSAPGAVLLALGAWGKAAPGCQLGWQSLFAS